jgi:probable O-glycosylation ligase (exosortase A-associated)
MRDLIIALIIFGAVPFMLARPSIGAYIWCWISYMNPHRLAFGWAYHFPFAAIVAGATLIGTLFTKDRQRIPWFGTTILWLSLILWMNFTTLFALVPDDAAMQWDRAMKIQLMAFVTLMIITTRQQLQWLIWAVTLSVGYFGIKGGMFAIATMGEYTLYGPPESFLADNNSLALAIVMIMPLWQYLRLTTKNRLVQLGCVTAMVLSVFAVLASYSRGAFVAISAMAFLLVLRSRAKAMVIAGLIVMTPIALSFMPDDFYERMGTIKTYQQDPSAIGRINAWSYAWNLAVDRPVIGGGFDAFHPELFKKYAPNPLDFHDAHSIYFEMLAEHGFVGLGLFFGLFFTTFRNAGWLRLQARDRPNLQWAGDLGSMLQVCIAGYAVGGAFLGLAYFDLPYHFVAFVVLARLFVERELAVSKERAAAGEEGVVKNELPMIGEGTASSR